MKTTYRIVLLHALFATTTLNAQSPVTFDVERAIRNPRTIDLAELATSVNYIPLDGTSADGLLSDVKVIAESKTGFYIVDDERRAVRFFDRRGRFVSTRGSIGRGPGEFSMLVDMAVDYDSDYLYVLSSLGGTQTPVLAYDAGGRFVARSTVDFNARTAAFHDGELIALQRSPDSPFTDRASQSKIGTWVPFLETFSPAVEHRQTVEIVDKGSGQIIIMNGGGTPQTLRSINLNNRSNGVLASNGRTLTVKDERGDLVYHYRAGTLQPAYRLDPGRYSLPDNLYGSTYSPDLGDYYLTQRLIESERYIFLTSRRTRDGETVQIVLDKTAPSGGFTAHGPGEANGLFLGGIAFTPMYVRDGRLVGWMSALDIADNADAITDSQLRSLAATLREDSNPVIVIVNLKK